MFVFAEIPHAVPGAQVWFDGRAWRLVAPGSPPSNAQKLGEVQALRHGVATIKLCSMGVLGGTAGAIQIDLPTAVKVSFKETL